ncbi:MAG: hypothetical protein ACPF9U_06005 [Flavobacteriaceae bacterium]
MRKTHILLFAFLLSFQGCCFYCDEEEVEYGSRYEPIYMSRTELNNSLQLKPAREIINSGKIYVVNNLLFVGEKLEGFHVFDNANPKNPVKVKFMQLLGTTDLAIRDNVVYANQSTDLVALEFDLDKETLKLTKRIENIFPELRSPDGYVATGRVEDNVVIGWKPKK